MPTIAGPSPGNTCIACGRDNTSGVFGVDSTARLPLRRCVTCETVFLSGWREGYVSELYEYYADCLGKSKAELYDPITEKRYWGLSQMLRRSAPGSRLLDVGCGHGHWVDFAGRAGWHVRGIDLSPFAVRLCQGFDLPVSETDFFSDELALGAYDLITMFELIEHVPSPAAFLRRAGDLLSPGGILFMTTPNFACLDRRLLAADWTIIHEQHLSYFTPRSLKKLVHSAGVFTDVQIRTRNASPAALRHALSRLRRGSPWATSTPTAPSVTPLHAQFALRKRIENSRVLSSAKAGLNGLLNAFDLGADMTMMCRRV